MTGKRKPAEDDAAATEATDDAESAERDSGADRGQAVEERSGREADEIERDSGEDDANR